MNVKMDRTIAILMRSALTLTEPLTANVELATLVMDRFASVSNFVHQFIICIKLAAGISISDFQGNFLGKPM